LLNDVEYYGSKEYGGSDVKVRTCLNIYKVGEIEIDPRDEMVDKIINVGKCYRKDKHNFEYYLSNGNQGRTGKQCKMEEFSILLGITVLEETYRTKIEEFLKDFNKNFEKELKQKQGIPFITNPFFKDKLKKFLWPTSEEKFEQNIKFVNNKEDADYIIMGFGYAATVLDKNSEHTLTFNLKITEEFKPLFESIMFDIRKKFELDDKNKIFRGRKKQEYKNRISKVELIEIISKLMWPNDITLNETIPVERSVCAIKLF